MLLKEDKFNVIIIQLVLKCLWEAFKGYVGGLLMKGSSLLKSKKSIIIVALTTALIILVLMTSVAYSYSSRATMNETVKMEAGGTLPSVETFIVESNNPGTFVTDMAAVDTTIPGEYTIKIKIKYRTYTSMLVIEDTTPPTIEGVKDQTVYLNSTISYKKDVIVSDNLGGAVTLDIDSSKVDLKTLGKYQVLYIATDESGNKTEATANVSVVAKPVGYVDEAVVNELADKVLAKIITSGMTDMQKLNAIFDYSRNHIAYTGSSDKSDWLAGAYRGFVKANGDCFTYYCTARALLTRAGFENMSVTRIEGTPTRHYWSLVLYNGGWYHFDSCLYRRGFPFRCMMKTDAQVAAYTEQVQYFYEFDHSKFPATPTEPIN
jgi:hypothetical protein